MNLPAHNSISNPGRDTTSGSAEATLRLLANLPAPRGIEDRVMVSLKMPSRTARVLHWPSVLQPTGSWMRGAAAAAIVFVVAGGGWGIYTRVQPTQATKVIVRPRAGAGGGFSNAGAMRTPQTVNGPVVPQPVATQQDDAQTATTQSPHVKPLKNTSARIVPMTKRRARAGAAN
jgi:hypothetical protein